MRRRTAVAVAFPCAVLFFGAGCLLRSPAGPRARAVEQERAVFCDMTGIAPEAAAALQAGTEGSAPALTVTRGAPGAAGPEAAEWLMAARDDTRWSLDRGKDISSAECGSIRVVVLNGDLFPAGDAARFNALREELALSRAAWKIVALRPPILRPELDRAALDVMELFEETGVTFVISGDSAGYQRSAPVGRSSARAVRYLNLGPRAEKTSPPRAAPWLTKTLDLPQRVQFDAQPLFLRMRVYSQDGRLLDSVRLTHDPERRIEARYFTVAELLAAGRPDRDSP